MKDEQIPEKEWEGLAWTTDTALTQSTDSPKSCHACSPPGIRAASKRGTKRFPNFNKEVDETKNRYLGLWIVEVVEGEPFKPKKTRWWYEWTQPHITAEMARDALARGSWYRLLWAAEQTVATMEDERAATFRPTFRSEDHKRTFPRCAVGPGAKYAVMGGTTQAAVMHLELRVYRSGPGEGLVMRYGNQEWEALMEKARAQAKRRAERWRNHPRRQKKGVTKVVL